MKKISPKGWLSFATLVLVLLVLWMARAEIVQAWHLLSRVNIWILALLLPVQILSYYAVGAMIFSYLKQKDDFKASSIEMAKMALELNFVNHVLPSGGVSGASYMSWRLSKLGVNVGRATLAQVVRIAVTFGAFLLLICLAVVFITIDGGINRFTILVSSALASGIVFATLSIIYIIRDRRRLHSFARFFTRSVNQIWSRVFRRRELLDADRVTRFLEDMHDDYIQLAREPRVLLRPFMWALVFSVSDIALFWLTFLALGTPINPAPLVIAYGLAGAVGIFLITPGGVGGYEAIMVGFLATTGISQSAVIAAVLLTRILLVLGTIATGYIFYQQALNRYGKRTS